jgi:tetratricopeptide (TPR) repeat protein
MLWREANEQLDILSEAEPRGRGHFQCRKASNLVVLGEYEAALALFAGLLDERPEDPFVWLNYGHALRTVSGRMQEAIDAFHKCLDIDAGYGAAWWSLADLKTYQFSSEETEAMRIHAARSDLNDMQRCQIEFALGTALETQKLFDQAFEHYRQGNGLMRPHVNHDAVYNTEMLKMEKAFFTPDFFAARRGSGCPSQDPIFIVGLPRSGSTLIEQILSSHSLVEGTMELHDLRDAIGELSARHEGQSYLTLLNSLDEGGLRALGERYLETTRSQRRLDRPLFTDKAPGNFVHVGLIRVILPNAKIIDARRHPLGCCFSCFKQIFPAGSTEFSYDLADMGSAYRDYVEFMAHFDRVLPGYVHRVFYEDMVRNPEGEIRRLLDYCRLPFEENCLRFYESDRAVRTVSSEQVRKPINASAGEKWRAFETWLGPAKDTLGEVLTRYPDVPEFN